MTLSRTPVLRCNTSIYFFFGQGLRDRFFFFFSISNSTLLFEQSSHLLSHIVLCRQTKPVNFCWLFSFSRFSHFLCWTDELLLFVIQLCVFSAFLLSFFFLLFLRTLYYTSMVNIVFFLYLFSSFFFSSLFFYYFFLWISTRICCVEHVNDCTPIRR
jgi:hypothetical protein